MGGKESETKRETFVWITVPMNCLRGIWYQMGILCCFCRIAARVGNLNPQPWIVMVEGSATRAWLALKRHCSYSIDFPSKCPDSIPRVYSTPKSYNYSMWSLLHSVLSRLMSFPKVWRLRVSYSLILCATLGTANGFNDQLRSAEFGINWGRFLMFLVCDCCCVCKLVCRCIYELFIYMLCLIHILECVCSAAAHEGFNS